LGRDDLMARIRTIKPTFFMNDELADLDPLTRLLLIGLWTQADREGRLNDRPKRIKASVLPYDECDIDSMLDDLADNGNIVRYMAGGDSYIQVVNFTKHQNPHYKEVPSEIPAPDGHQDSNVVAPPLTEAERQYIFDRDGRVCCECQATDNLTIDHITPRSCGGTNDPDNLRVLCRSCNASKGNRVQSNVGSTSAQRRTQEGKGGERKGEDAREEIPDEKIVHSTPHPPCLNTSIEVIDPAYTGSCWGFIVGQAEAQFGTLLSPAERTELADAITQGCIHGCTGEHPVECAVHIYDKLKLKGKTRFATSRLWLKCIREDRMEVRQ
jgi:hypothetical protein